MGLNQQVGLGGVKLHKEEYLFVGDEPGKDSYRALERGY
jgi:hypothetical protein